MEELRSYLLLTAVGAELVLTKHDLANEPEALAELAAGGPDKFIAYEVPLEKVREKYQAHYTHVFSGPEQENRFITLDADGREVFTNVSLKDIGKPIIYEPRV